VICDSAVLDRRNTRSTTYGEPTQNLRSKSEVNSSYPSSPTYADDCFARSSLASTILENLAPTNQVQNRTPPNLSNLSDSCYSIDLYANAANTSCGETIGNLQSTPEFNSFDLPNPNNVQDCVKQGTYAYTNLGHLASTGQLKRGIDFYLMNYKLLPLHRIGPQSRSVSFSDNLSETSQVLETYLNIITRNVRLNQNQNARERNCQLY